MWALVIISLIFAFLLYYDVRDKRRIKNRERRLKTWATGKGLEYDWGPNRHLFYEFPQFECLQPGVNRYAYNIVKGIWKDRNVLAFDYHFKVDPKGPTCYFSAVIVESHTPLKTLLIRPEKFSDKVANSLGFHDIEFESDEFNRMFRIGAPEKRWAYDVLHPRVMEILISEPKFLIKFEGMYAIAYRPMVMSIEDFDAGIELLCGILDLVPEYVTQQPEGESLS
ncbi:MAG: hypothetical protein KAV00_13450 [Phycisphaerae bacterium]|nr:hypothetical protein [Phycisphaerae bacterium]